MDNKQYFAQYFAEAIGTFFLVFFGCGAIILSETNHHFNGFFIPLVFGGAVSIMIYATGHISGAHFNPAVTLAFWVLTKIPGKRVIGYLFAQFIGASLASLVHFIIFGSVIPVCFKYFPLLSL